MLEHVFDTREMNGVREAVSRFAAGFDPALISAADAERIVTDAAAAENMLATVKALAAARVAETELWRRRGDASAAHHLARTSGTSVAKARQALEAAGRLSTLPAVAAAARRGELSPAQLAPITDAASRTPAAERRLLTAAGSTSLGELLDACARTKAAADPDHEARHGAIHAGRFLRRRRCEDGAGELHYRSTLEEVAEIYAVVRAHADRCFRAARADGRREPSEAHLADGLLAAARAAVVRTTAATTAAPEPPPPSEDVADITAAPEPPPPSEDVADTCTENDPVADDRAMPPSSPPPVPAKVVVRIDWDALLRGWPIDGEVCEIAGLGPVPVSAVRAMIGCGNAFLAAVVTRGVDVVNVAHLGRSPTAYQRSALQWLSPSCTVLGCNATEHLEIDHREDWATSKVTLLSALDPLCDHHHDLKTRASWALVDGAGKRPMVPPAAPPHPRHAQAARAPDAEGAA